MNKQLFSNFQDFRASLNECFLEREDIIDGLLASLITKQNSFLFGLPGTGKSELVRAVSKGFEGSNFFSYLLSPTTDPSELFGPVAVSKLLKDEYVRDVEGYLPSANIAFLDELFRGSSAVLNSLLTILNERTFNNGRNVITTPIQSIVAATNSFPQEEALQAFCDRFLFRPTVESLRKPTSKRMLDAWALGQEARPIVKSKLTFNDLSSLQDIAVSIKASDGFMDAFSQILELLAGRGISISDRRRVQILKFLQGWAVVQGDDKIYPEHLRRCLVHIMYTSKKDVEVIEEVIDNVIPSMEKLINAIKRAHTGLQGDYHHLAMMTGADKSLGSLNEAVIKMRKIYTDINTLADKLKNVLNSGEYRESPETRLAAMKLLSSLEGSASTCLNTINKISA